MSNSELLNASCADQTVDAVVNAANDGLWEGGGICGVIFRKAGSIELSAACRHREAYRVNRTEKNHNYRRWMYK